MKQAILDRLNEFIAEEKGVRVTMDSMFSDAELDSLGTVITLAMLESEYPIFKDLDSDITDLISGCGLNVVFEAGDCRMLERPCVIEEHALRPARCAARVDDDRRAVGVDRGGAGFDGGSVDRGLEHALERNQPVVGFHQQFGARRIPDDDLF